VSLNADLVRARCTEIEESLSRLERFRSLPLEAFLQDVADLREFSRAVLKLL
jgi:hypothetical protein